MHITELKSHINLYFLFENCTPLCYYSASSDNSIPTVRGNLSVPYSRAKNGFMTFEDGTERLSRTVGKELSFLAA